MASTQENTSTQTKDAIIPEKSAAQQIFECTNCGLREEYHYFGKKPPFCKSIVFVEDSYVIRDPFTSQSGNNANFLLLGGNCAVCAKMTCQECSLFFTKRFCADCSQINCQLLPEELHKKKKKG